MDTYSVTDLRHKTSEVLSAAKQLGYIAVLKNSRKDAFVVDASYFLALQESYENYLDTLEYDLGKKSLKKESAISIDAL